MSPPMQRAMSYERENDYRIKPPTQKPGDGTALRGCAKSRIILRKRELAIHIGEHDQPERRACALSTAGALRERAVQALAQWSLEFGVLTGAFEMLSHKFLPLCRSTRFHCSGGMHVEVLNPRYDSRYGIRM